MRIDILTLFPEFFSAGVDESIIGRARKRGYLQVCSHQLRDFSKLRNSKVDDTVFGGGKGMLLMAEPISAGIDSISEHLGVRPHIIYMSPRGSVLTQEKAKKLSKLNNLVILCGHYEGVDERVLEEYDVEEISIGDYVLTGGELPAMVLVDVMSRMVGGVLSDDECFTEESHYNGLLEYPQYTRPETWRERSVPKELLSGHHENIRKWRRKQSLKTTQKNRPDMIEKLELSVEDKKLLE